jgi:hypothetical protein
MSLDRFANQFAGFGPFEALSGFVNPLFDSRFRGLGSMLNRRFKTMNPRLRTPQSD